MSETEDNSVVDEQRASELSRTSCMAFTVELGKQSDVSHTEDEQRRLQLDRPIRAFVPRRLLHKEAKKEENEANNQEIPAHLKPCKPSKSVNKEAKEDEFDSSHSDTGTYVIDGEDESDAIENNSDSLHDHNEHSHSKVQEWSERNEALLQKASSLASNVSNTSSRRRLPDVPDNNNSSALLTNSLLRETYETVTAMEERIRASKIASAKPRRSTTTTSNSVSRNKAKEKEEEAKRLKRLAWERRKNYDPKQVGPTNSNGSSRSRPSRRDEDAFDGTSQNSDEALVRSEEEERLCVSMHASTTAKDSDLRTNRAFALRQQMNKARPVTTQSLIQRAEQARRSLRGETNPKEKIGISTNKASVLNQRRTSATSVNGARGGKSASTLTSKEADFLAWRRRKEYKPSSSAANTAVNSGPHSLSPVHNSSVNNFNGHSTASGHSTGPLGRHLAKRSSQGTAVAVVTPSSLLQTRSASFHYPEMRGDSSEEEYPSLAQVDVADPADLGDLDEDEFVVALGERPSSGQHSRSTMHNRAKYLQPLASSGVHVHNRKTKRGEEMETLDTLVISTLFSLSARLCRKSSRLIRKAEEQQKMEKNEDKEQLALMDTLLYVLDDCELPASPSKQSSRELAGALRNLKKVEQAMQVLEETCFLID